MEEAGRRWPWGLVLVASGVVLVSLLVYAQDARSRHVEDSRVGGPHAFERHQPGDPADPVAWDPCRPIRYEVNPEDGPDDAAAFVADAVAEVGRISGLDFVYEGETSRRPTPGESDPGSEPVLVAWADEDEVPDLSGDVVGVAGPVALRLGDLWRYVGGQVALDTDLGHDLDSAAARAVLLHELGHVVGLDHVDDPTQLMFSESTFQEDFGPGDREGLVLLGQGRCF
ncbi:MAG TPA: matrixin family metalloprotease [Nocardioides sp.]|nr:matrixin family metalloprotease [Nocardioides sp.]